MNKNRVSHAVASLLGTGMLLAPLVSSAQGVTPSEQVVSAVIATAHVPDTPQMRAQIRHDLAARNALLTAARAAGYEGRKDVIQRTRIASDDILINAYMGDKAVVAPVSDSEVRAAYDAYASQARGRMEYKTSVITLDDRSSAEAVADAIHKGVPFEDLAKQYSHSPVAGQGGAAPWVSLKVPVDPSDLQGITKEVAQTIEALKVGEITATPLQMGGKWLLIRLDDRRQAYVPSFAEAAQQIRQQLEQQARKRAEDRVVDALLTQSSP